MNAFEKVKAKRWEWG